MTRRKFTTYDPATGRIMGNGVASNWQDQSPEYERIVDQHIDGNEWYIVNGEPAPRPDPLPIIFSPATIAADNIDETEVLGIEVGAVLIFGGIHYDISDLDVRLSTDLVGPNKVIVEYFPHKPFIGTFHATN